MGWFRSTSSGGDTDGTESLTDRLSQIAPGVPGRCPACDGLGYIDSIDIGHRFQIQHCKECGHRWEYVFDDDGAVVELIEQDDDGESVHTTRLVFEADHLETGPVAVDPEPDLAPGSASAPEPEASPAPEPRRPLRAERQVDDRARSVTPRDEAGANDDRTIDLRTTAVDEVQDDDDVHAKSPAEWLRHSIGR